MGTTPDQRAPRPPRRRDDRRAEIARLGSDAHLVLDLLYRARVLTPGQIGRFLFAPSRGERDGSRHARTLMREIEGRGYLVRIDREGEQAPLYMPARACRAWFEERHGVRLDPQELPSCADDVRRQMLAHDVAANEIVLGFSDPAGARTVEAFSREVRMGLELGNWIGARQLALGFHDPVRGGHRMLFPDAFCAPSVRIEGATGERAREGLVPVLIEYDRGSRKPAEVMQQLAAYQVLARTGALGRRLPDLAVPGYTCPLVMVCHVPGRVRSLGDETFHGGAPIFLVAERDLSGGPEGAPARPLADPDPERRLPLMEALIGANRRLLHDGRLWAGSLLRIDPDAARPSPKGANAAR